MFSGLIDSLAEVKTVQQQEEGIDLVLVRPANYSDLEIGESIAISGCCLTLVESGPGEMTFQAGQETLAKTTLGQLKAGDFVNCERSLKLGDRIGGHLVSGHVDGLGRVSSRVDAADWSTIHIAAPVNLLTLMAPKGSITVDGVSLTLVEITRETFSVALIPHTLEVTTLGQLSAGDQVNLETDLLAKYVQQQLSAAGALQAPEL